MRANQLLGVGWLAFCGYYCVSLLRQLEHGFSAGARPTLGLLIPLVAVAVCLVGVLASVFLFRGARWARRVIGLIATLMCLAVIAQFVVLSFSWFACALGVFSVVSLAALVLSRKATAVGKAS